MLLWSERILMRQDSLTPEDQMSDGSFREFSFEVQHRYLFSPEERDVYSLNASPIAPRSGGAQCFGWFANSPYVSLLTERGLIRAAGAINISLRWSEGTFSKLHLKLECAI